MAAPKNRRGGNREPDFASPMYENDPRDSNYPVETLPRQMGSTPDPLGLLDDALETERSDE